MSTEEGNERAARMGVSAEGKLPRFVSIGEWMHLGVEASHLTGYPACIDSRVYFSSERNDPFSSLERTDFGLHTSAQRGGKETHREF